MLFSDYISDRAKQQDIGSLKIDLGLDHSSLESLDIK